MAQLSTEQSRDASGRRHEASLRVSSKSTFGDEVWFLDGFAPSAPLYKQKLIWDFEVTAGILFCGPQFAHWRESTKKLIYGVLAGELITGPQRESTAVGTFDRARRLIRYTSERGCRTFSDITDSLLKEYLAWLRPQLGHNSFGNELSFLKQLIELGEYIGDPPSILAHFEPAWRPKETPGIPFIPDEIAGPLLSEACRWVLELSKPILRYRQTVADAYDTVMAAAESKSSREHRGRAQAIISSSDASAALCAALGLESISGSDFNVIVYDLIAACYIVIFGLVGMRISEVAGLNVGCLISREVEGTQALLLSSNLIKTAPAYREPKLWVAGPDVPRNPVRWAVDTMTDLFALERKASGSRLLFSVFSLRNSVGLGAPRKQLQVVVMLQKFLDRRVGNPSKWKISTHQFRKTFARFVARHEVVAVEALQRHFKHVSIVMLSHYLSRDLALLDEIQDEVTRFASEGLDSIIGSEHLAGQLGEAIAARNGSFRGLAGKEVRESYIRLVLENSDLVIQSHRYGICVFRREGANCGGKPGRVGLNTCMPCRNLVIGQRHLPYWQERASSLRAWSSELPGATADAAQRFAIDEQIAEAERVISLIDLNI